MSLKQTPKSLIVVRDNVRTLKGAKKILELILEDVGLMEKRIEDVDTKIQNTKMLDLKGNKQLTVGK